VLEEHVNEGGPAGELRGEEEIGVPAGERSADEAARLEREGGEIKAGQDGGRQDSPEDPGSVLDVG